MSIPSLKAGGTKWPKPLCGIRRWHLLLEFEQIHMSIELIWWQYCAPSPFKERKRGTSPMAAAKKGMVMASKTV